MTPDNESLRPALRSTRILWGALLEGELTFLAVIIWLQVTGRIQPIHDAMTHTLSMIAFGGLLLIPVGYYARMQIYKAHWQANVVTATGYRQGNLVLWAVCEMTCFFALVVAMIGGLWPAIVPAAIAMATQAVNFPTGRPMRPTEPQFD